MALLVSVQAIDKGYVYAASQNLRSVNLEEFVALLGEIADARLAEDPSDRFGRLLEDRRQSSLLP